MKVDLNISHLSKFGNKMTRFLTMVPIVLDHNRDVWLRTLLEEVKKNASGRPGPNIVTGRYVNSFMIVGHKVVNPSPQTYRLEYGFIGRDALGRRYAQPPYPHFRPALAKIGPEYRRSIIPVVLAVWREA
jgi:hypothetical protein